jgi:transcriptional regulator
VYPLPEFKESDREVILDFMRRHPLAMLTGVSEQGRVAATHVPLLIREEGADLILRGHVMRKTDHWSAFHANPHVLAAFTGPDAPILASWYAEPFNGGTWNYSAVHAHGTLRFLPQSGLLDILRELKNHFETDPGSKFEHLPQDYLDMLVPAIEGFEIRVETLGAVFKLSQNRDDADFQRVVMELDGKGGEAALLAGGMRAQRGRQMGDRG